MQELKRPIHVFLIHAHLDRETVRDLYACIAQAGIRAWLDTERLQPGQDWEYEIRNAIRRSDVILVCLSERFNRRGGYRHKELRIALEKVDLLPDGGVFIIPVRLEKCDTPGALRRWQRVDLFEADGYERLIHSLRRYAEIR
jgi:hypothetical protein